MLTVLVEEVAHREVVELQSHTSYDTCLSPTERELYLVVGLLHESVVDVHRSVFRIRLHVRVNLLRVEVSH